MNVIKAWGSYNAARGSKCHPPLRQNQPNLKSGLLCISDGLKLVIILALFGGTWDIAYLGVQPHYFHFEARRQGILESKKQKTPKTCPCVLNLSPSEMLPDDKNANSGNCYCVFVQYEVFWDLP